MKFHIFPPLVNKLWPAWFAQPKPIIWPRGSPSMGYRFTDTDTSMSEWPGLKDFNNRSIPRCHISIFRLGPSAKFPPIANAVRWWEVAGVLFKKVEQEGSSRGRREATWSALWPGQVEFVWVVCVWNPPLNEKFTELRRGFMFTWMSLMLNDQVYQMEQLQQWF